MTDTEYDILDELYFVTPYAELKEQTGFEDPELKTNLWSLFSAGLIKVYRSIDEEMDVERVDFEGNYPTYFYLATKKGLFEHNQR